MVWLHSWICCWYGFIHKKDLELFEAVLVLVLQKQMFHLRRIKQKIHTLWAYIKNCMQLCPRTKRIQTVKIWQSKNLLIHYLRNRSTIKMAESVGCSTHSMCFPLLGNDQWTLYWPILMMVQEIKNILP
jgi:hypothetical protein